MNDPAKVLIVDDFETNIIIMESFLLPEGYQILKASNGIEALKLVKDENPDLILLDVMMPGISGFEVSERIKSNEKTKMIPIVIVTAMSDKEARVQALEAGADDFIMKPINRIELKTRVHSMMRIKKQYELLQQKSKNIEDMVHMVVHDMRTPLQSMLINIALIEMDGAEKCLLESLKKDTNRLKTFTNDILKSAKMEHGKLVLNLKKVNVTELLKSFKNEYVQLAKSRNINFSINYPEQSNLEFDLDKSLFHRLIDNLLSNAFKYSPEESSVVLNVSLNQSSDSKEENKMIIKVIDQGEGVPDKYKDKIFDRYEIGQLKKDNVQIGIGLSFCKLIAETHGGNISVSDNTPKGSIFTISL